MIRGARGAGLLAAATVLAACGGGSGGSVHSAAPTTTTTTTTAGSGAGGSVNIGIICSTPADAATTVVNAWRSGGRNAARRCAAPAAVDVLFARAAGTNAWTLQQCVGTVCSLTSSQGSLRLTVSGSDAAGWVVTRAQFGH